MLRPLFQQLADDLPDSAVGQQRGRMKAFECVFLVLLIAASAKLWHKPIDSYPQVPLVALGMHIPGSFGTIGVIGLLVASSMAASNQTRTRRLGSLGFCLFAGGLAVSDQHRLQPWLYQLGLLSCFTMLLCDRWYLVASRLLLISIYLFSAVSKLDYLFLHTLGQQFAIQFGDFVGFDVATLNSASRAYVASMFPACEMLLGLGLCMRGTRKLAGWLAIAMHVSLLLILGPFGLDHHLGVLVWNAFFIAQLWMLFVRLPPTAARGGVDAEPVIQSSSHSLSMGRVPLGGLKELVCCTLVLLPVLEPFGLMDHWPAWQLYAPRNSRVTFSVLESRAQQLPGELQQHLTADNEPLSPWKRLNIDAWSLSSVGVPIYPQSRFQLGVCLGVAEYYDLEGGVRVEVHSTADRWTGERDTKTLRGIEEIAEAAQRSFRLNAVPRGSKASP